jgi:hypothetical protein
MLAGSGHAAGWPGPVVAAPAWTLPVRPAGRRLRMLSGKAMAVRNRHEASG